MRSGCRFFLLFFFSFFSSFLRRSARICLFTARLAARRVGSRCFFVRSSQVSQASANSRTMCSPTDPGGIRPDLRSSVFRAVLSLKLSRGHSSLNLSIFGVILSLYRFFGFGFAWAVLVTNSSAASLKPWWLLLNKALSDLPPLLFFLFGLFFAFAWICWSGSPAGRSRPRSPWALWPCLSDLDRPGPFLPFWAPLLGLPQPLPVLTTGCQGCAGRNQLAARGASKATSLSEQLPGSEPLRYHAKAGAG